MNEPLPVATPYDNPVTLADRLLAPSLRRAWLAGFAEGAELRVQLRLVTADDAAMEDLLEAAVMIGQLGLTKDQIVPAVRQYMGNQYPERTELRYIRSVIDRRLNELGDT